MKGVKMNKSVCLLVAVFLVVTLLIAPMFVSGFDVKVKTMANHKVGIQILDVSQVYYLLESFYKNSGDTGIVDYSYTTDKEVVNVRVLVSKGNTTLYYEKYENVPTNVPFVVELIPGVTPGNTTETNTTEAETNQTAAENQTVAETAEETSDIENKSGLTGKAIFEDVKEVVFSKTTYYILGIIVLGIAAFFIFRKVRKMDFSGFSHHTPKYVGGSSKGGSERLVIKSDDKALLSAERKVREAQEEISKLKERKNKLADAERRFEADKKELEKLRGY